MFNQKTIRFCNQFNVKLPIIQAPMAGKIVTPALIREVAKNGGLGSLPLGYLSIDEAREAIHKTTALTDQQFAVNLFISTPHNASINQTNYQHDGVYKSALFISSTTVVIQ